MDAGRNLRSACAKPVATIALVLAAAVGCVSQDALELSGMSFTEQPLVGKVVWNDLITDDLDSARRFYGDLFGWTFERATVRAVPIIRSRDQSRSTSPVLFP